MGTIRCQRFIRDTRCDSNATHDLEFGPVVIGWTPPSRNREESPIYADGVIRLIVGSYYCRTHSVEWARQINERREAQQALAGH